MAPAAAATPELAVKATAAERSVVVNGNVRGSVVVGDHNWVVNDNHGTINAQTVIPTRTRRPRAGPPRAPDPFVGRVGELDRLTARLAAHQPVTVSGAAGAGRTAVMRAAANRPELAPVEGVLRIDGVDGAGTALSIGDLVQRLHDAAWETVPQAKVTIDSARSHLAPLDAVAIVDDVTLSSDELERLADLLPIGAVVIATKQPPIDSEFEDVAIPPLGRAEAITLLAARSGLAADPTSADELDAIAAALGDWPEALVVGGNAIRRRSLTAAAARAELVATAAGMGEPSVMAIERAWSLAQPALDENARRLLVAAAALPATTHDPAILRRILDDPPWFDPAAATLSALGLMTLNSPRYRVPDGVRAIVRDEAVALVPDLADRHLEVMLLASRERSLDPAFVGDELGGLLGAVEHATRRGRFADAVALGRAITPRLVLDGLWDAWQTVVEEVRSSATKAQRTADVAWAAHELGTRDLALGDVTSAGPRLREALTLRRELGDTEGAAYTIHNMARFGLAVLPTGGGAGTILLGAVVVILGLAALAFIGPPALAFVAGIVGPAETPTPTGQATAEPTPTGTPTAAPTTTPALAVDPKIGSFDFSGSAWSTTLEIGLSGGVGDYRIALDGFKETTDNPASFRIDGVVCLGRQVTGTAYSGPSIQQPIEIDVAPTACPTPTPPPISKACVTFDDLPVRTNYGRDGGQQPGDTVLKTPEGVVVSVEFFRWSPRFLTVLAETEPAGATSITVRDRTKLPIGTRFWIDVGPSAEEAIVVDYSGDQTIFLDGPLTFAHVVGTGVYVPDPTRGEFGTATVFEPSEEFGSGPYLWFNNVNLAFDFSGLPFVPSLVEFAFRDRGGNENLSVNDSELLPLELVEAPSQVGDVAWSWVDPEADRIAVGMLKGPVRRFVVGGQEFALDTVCAYP